MDHLHIVLASTGTDGDIHPFLNLGAELRDRGHRVTLATHEHFAACATGAGLEFHPLVSNAETEELLAQPGLWRPLQAPVVDARWGARFIRRQYDLLSRLADPKHSVLVASPGVVAARVVQETLGVPLVSVLLQPWMIPSLHAPPVMMGGLTLPRWAPRPVGQAYFRLFDGVGALLVGKELGRLRASQGLKPTGRMFQWWLSPELVIALFPAWFGAPQCDWPAQIRLAGFPLNERHPGGGMPADTLDFCRAGSPPIVFTFGTGMRHAADLFREGIEACRILGSRCVMVTSLRSQLPVNLPASVHHCEFAPFQQLFPLCAAVVHHGGIGTVAQALASGIPQLVIPLAFDQMDNALKVQMLGTGQWLKRSRTDGQVLYVRSHGRRIGGEDDQRSPRRGGGSMFSTGHSSHLLSRAPGSSLFGDTHVVPSTSCPRGRLGARRDPPGRRIRPP